MRQHWLGLVAACAFGLGARAETVDTIRVFEHNAVPQPQLPPQPAAGARCVPPAPVGAATSTLLPRSRAWQPSIWNGSSWKRCIRFSLALS